MVDSAFQMAVVIIHNFLGVRFQKGVNLGSGQQGAGAFHFADDALVNTEMACGKVINQGMAKIIQRFFI